MPGMRTACWSSSGWPRQGGRRLRAAGADAAAGVPVHDYRGKIITPGFIDTHLHFPQTDMIASPAPGLLPWLETYTFPTERQFKDPCTRARPPSSSSTSCCATAPPPPLVYCTVHKESVDALFEASAARNLRMGGRQGADGPPLPGLPARHLPTLRESEELIKRWHKQGRAMYAITPRFAPTSTEAQLAATGELARAYPDTFIQTHVSENQDEVKLGGRAVPAAPQLPGRVRHYGLMRPRALFGHCIWLDDADFARMAETGSAIAHCPTSNLFLGSGLFDIARPTRPARWSRWARTWAPAPRSRCCKR
jgi:guanine deaminase